MRSRIHTETLPRKSNFAWRWDISLTSMAAILSSLRCERSSPRPSLSNLWPTTALREVNYQKSRRTRARRSLCQLEVTSLTKLANPKEQDRGPTQACQSSGKRSSNRLLRNNPKTSTIRHQKFFLWWASTLMIRLMPWGGKRTKSWRITRRRLRGQSGLQTSRLRVQRTIRRIPETGRRAK